MKLFSDFWQYSVVMGFSSEEHGVWLQDWYDGVKEIAVKIPKLTFATSERSNIRLIAFNYAIPQEGVSLNQLHELKQQLLQQLVFLFSLGEVKLLKNTGTVPTKLLLGLMALVQTRSSTMVAMPLCLFKKDAKLRSMPHSSTQLLKVKKKVFSTT